MNVRNFSAIESRRFLSPMLSLLLLLLQLLSVCEAQTGQQLETLTLVCPSLPMVVRSRSDYVYTSGLGAHKLHEEPLTWNVARKICNTEGAHLAVINSEAEALKLARMFREIRSINGTDDYEHSWLGFHGHFETLDFVTIHGDPLISTGYTSWQRNEPTGGREYCGAIGKDGGLSDLPCDLNIVFFCEIPNRIISVQCDA
ncbi:hypothetical protein KPH14_007063 [Odynerus spinipes]|uniref:C-type lectin domain-containing protein n=1 Tax=Odynerus spinipes TaxID=1348599 RepID=A0AAD9RRV6_9HYME|nr:hypothetical protein KPH14_007063 [Odynerus spinipes]